MKTISQPLFLVFSALFIANQLIERMGIVIPIVHSYLDDLLCLPLTLTIALFIQQKITGSPTYLLSKNKIIFVWLFYSLYFEAWLPKVYSRYTADFLDVLVYGAGAFIFYIYLNKPLVKNKGIAVAIPS
jgi:hypothetical protein